MYTPSQLTSVTENVLISPGKRMHFYCLLRKRNITKVSGARVKFGPIYLALNLLLVSQLTMLLSFSFLFHGSFRIDTIPEKAKWLMTLLTHFPLAITTYIILGAIENPCIWYKI